ncbi:multiple sugar transport system substrate-binding protein [Nocardioides alpinus]|uniref:ABC transporter substrate-binding protein n=1 Tax=Nocardioides alpinus TaxID=748909 RepID=A0A1I0WBI6_9ACTN|nr:extracellular solute-binding protein [Nocardioides alpinus]PKH37824.1 ABC transporter substrate-binding protein [Nocardioides alpinus]SFA86115.1 multiple sugar transport system substrate-binding protein [Nocardioides alpinus]
MLSSSRRRQASLAALALTSSLALAACGGGGFEEEGGSDPASSGDGPAELQVLIGSSGDAETQAVEEAAQAWAEESGNEVEVIVANDIAQQLSQGFAGGNPPDLFYVDAGVFGDYAEAGNLYPYLDQMADADDFYPNLVDSFTLDDQAYCAPKDFSTLALQINTEAWKKAGLTDADVPTTWDELETVAQQLTTPDQAGLVLGLGRDRVGAFLVQNGGFWVDGEAGEATATEPTNAEALEYVQGLLDSGSAVLAPDVDAGWGGEAFGTQKAAMTIEGNWIRGAMENDYPDVDYTVAELPEGPAGKGTLLFTQCWGIAADSPNQEAAVSLVEAMTTAEQQLTNAEAFGVMPSRESAQADYVEQFPQDAPFIAGGDYGQGPVNLPGLGPVVADLDSQLEQLKTADVNDILESFQQNAEAELK